MGIIEVIFISIALSLDVFGVMLCKGSMIHKINKSKLMNLSIIFGIWQFVAITLGNIVTNIPILKSEFNDLGKNFTGVIFITIGIYLLRKAIKKEIIDERRLDRGITYKDIMLISLIFGLDVFFTGVGFSILGTNVFMGAFILVSISILSVVLGVYIGYFIGHEHKEKAYLVGSTILIISGIYTLFKF